MNIARSTNHPTPGSTILLLRHGETDFKEQGRYQGASDHPALTKRGVSQTLSFVRYMANSHVDRVYCSPVRRARETLEHLAGNLQGLSEIHVLPELTESSIPEWEGMLKSDIAARDAYGLYWWRTRPHEFFDSTGRMVLSRLHESIAPTIKDLSQLPGTTLLVGHDHLNRAIMSQLMRLPLSVHPCIPQELSGLTLLHRDLHQGHFELRASNLHQGGDRARLDKNVRRPRIILVRHGTTEANRERIYQGPVFDPSLNDEGIAQVERLEGILGGLAAQAIISSPLLRAQETAKRLPFGEDVERLIDPRLAEYHYGRWIGLTENEVANRFPEEVAALYIGVDEEPIHGAETLPTLFQRIRSFLRFTWTIAHRHQSTVVVVAHDVVIRAAIAMSIPVDPRQFWQFPIRNAAVTELVASEYGNIQVRRHNILPGSLEDRHDDEYF